MTETVERVLVPEAVARTKARERRVAVADVAGLLLVAAVVGWWWLRGSGSVEGGCVAAAVSGFLVGRLTAPAGRWIAPALVLGAGVGLLAAGGVFVGGPLSGSFGYANATGAFFMQATVAGAMLARSARWPAVKVAGIAGAAVFAAVPLATRSVAAAVWLLAIPLVWLAVRRRRHARLAIAVCAGLFVAVLAATAVLGATYAPGRRSGALDRAVDASLSERRVALWHDALVLISRHPVAGVGPGRFPLESPTARADADTRFAHNDFLERGAETGIPGMLLLLALFLWGFALLWSTRHAGVTAALAAVSLAALGTNASVDYVLHFPAIPAVAAALLGTATARAGRAR